MSSETPMAAAVKGESDEHTAKKRTIKFVRCCPAYSTKETEKTTAIHE